MNPEKGIVQVYTGDGKGKTTAAVGLALRAVGRNLKVGFFQFFKPPASGEVRVLRKMRNLQYRHFCPIHPAFRSLTPGQLRQLKKKFADDWKRVVRLVKTGKFDLVVLDEILIAVQDGFLTEENLLELVDRKPGRLELVLTGRKLPQRILERAGLVTEMRCLKHPFPKLKARRGIEY